MTVSGLNLHDRHAKILGAFPGQGAFDPVDRVAAGEVISSGDDGER